MTTQNEHTHIIQLVYPTSKDTPFLVVHSYLHLQETSMWFSQFSCSSSIPPARYAVAPIQVVAHDGRYCVASAWGWRLEKISHLV